MSFSSKITLNVSFSMTLECCKDMFICIKSSLCISTFLCSILIRFEKWLITFFRPQNGDLWNDFSTNEVLSLKIYEEIVPLATRFEFVCFLPGRWKNDFKDHLKSALKNCNNPLSGFRGHSRIQEGVARNLSPGGRQVRTQPHSGSGWPPSK